MPSCTGAGMVSENLWWMLGGIVGGGLVSWLITHQYHLRTKRTADEHRDRQTAFQTVTAMSSVMSWNNSTELGEKVDEYEACLKRARADGRGAPVIRGDGSIGVDWSLTLTEPTRASAQTSASV